MLSATLQARLDPALMRVGRVLGRTGITPNSLTLAGLLINIVAALFFSRGWFLWGGLLMVPGGCLDVLDGPLARATGRDSQIGSLVDSVVDRYSDLTLLIGIASFYSKKAEVGTVVLTLVVMVGFLAVPYVRARAEAFLPSCRVGLMERTERWFLLALGAVINQMPLILWVLAVLTHATVIQRVYFVWKQLKGPAPTAHR